MEGAFIKAFNRTIDSEGLFQNDPRDRGNWTSGVIGQGECKGTKYGISAMSYPDLDIANLSLTQAMDIYYRDWWVKLGITRFPGPLQFQVFDAAINHGMYNAVRMAQWAVKVKADGIIGPITFKAIQSVSADDLLLNFLAERLVFMTDISGWDAYGRGWARRIAHNLKYASEDN